MDTTTPKADAPRFRLLKRLAIVAIVLAAAWWFFRDAPKTVELTFRLDGVRDGLVAVTADLAREDGMLAYRLERRFVAGEEPPLDLTRKVKLARGKLTVLATLEYRDGTRRDVKREVAVKGAMPLADDEQVTTTLGE